MKRKLKLIVAGMLLCGAFGMTSCSDDKEPESIVIPASSLVGTWQANFDNFEGYANPDEGILSFIPDWMVDKNYDLGKLYFYYASDGSGLLIQENNLGIAFEKISWNLKDNALTLRREIPEIGPWAGTYLITGIKNNVMTLYAMAGLLYFDKVSNNVLDRYSSLITGKGAENKTFKVDDVTPSMIYMAFCSQHSNSLNFVTLYSSNEEEALYDQFSFGLKHTSFTNMKVGDNVTNELEIFLFGVERYESDRNEYVSGAVYVQSVSNNNITLRFNDYKFKNDYSESGYAVINGSLTFAYEQ